MTTIDKIAATVATKTTNGVNPTPSTTPNNLPPGTLTPPPTRRPEAALTNCPDCAGVGYLRLDVLPGDPRFGKPVPCANPVHNPDRLARLAKLSGLKEKDLKRRLADIIPNGDNQPMIDAARQMIDEPFGWLYIYGGPGNAKSEVLIAIVNELRLKGHQALYVTFAQLVDYMRDAFKETEKGGYTDRFERIKAIPVLAIDEMDKARETDMAMEFRFHFLDDRYRSAVHGETFTIFASNSAPDKLPEPITDRVHDGRFKVIHNKAGSARRSMRRK